MSFWYNDSKDMPRIGRIVSIFVAAALIIGFGIYFLTYATAETRGRIALHNQQRSPEQLQASYEYFHDTCRDVIAKGQQLTTLQATYDAQVKARPANDPFGQYAAQLQQLSTQVAGLSNLRDSEAQQYNAKTHEFTVNFMKSHDLPYEIGPPTGVAYVSLKCEK